MEESGPILLVEDSAGMAFMARMALQPVGREIIHTTNVHDTLAVLERRGEKISAGIFDGNIPLDPDEGATTDATDGSSIKRVIRYMGQLELLHPELVIVSFSISPFSRYDIGKADVAPAQFIEFGKQRVNDLGKLLLGHTRLLRR